MIAKNETIDPTMDATFFNETFPSIILIERLGYLSLAFNDWLKMRKAWVMFTDYYN